MKVEHEEIEFSYQSDEEGISHKNEMLSKGWRIKDVHPFLLKVTYIK